MAEEKENGEKEKTLLDYAINLSPEAALIAGLTEEQQKAVDFKKVLKKIKK